jgi:hypothetical protein
MKGKKYSAEQIVTKLREAEVLLGKGMALGELNDGAETTTRSDHTARWASDHQHQKRTNLFSSPMPEGTAPHILVHFG